MASKRPHILTFIAFLALSLFFSTPLAAKLIEYNGQILDIAEPGESIPGQIVVVAKNAKADKEIYILARTLGATILHNIEQLSMYLLEFPGDPIAQSALKELKQKYSADYDAFPNYKLSIPMPPDAGLNKFEAMVAGSGEVSPLNVSNDTLFHRQWWLHKIKEPWAGAPHSGKKHIAVIDSGVDYLHPDLEGKVISVFDYVDWDYDAMDENGHGTHVAGIAGAKYDNDEGIHSVSPQSKIYAYRVLDRYGSGGFYQVAAAIIDAADNPYVAILNLSLGGYLPEGSPEYNAFESVVSYAYATRGKIVCAAAGNESNAVLFLDTAEKWRPVPAYFPESFTVGATDTLDRRVWFSNYDVATAGGIQYYFYFVDIVAPGWKIISTYLDGQYRKLSGTSMSSPMVAGACARIWDKWPAAANSWIEAQLQSTGVSVSSRLGFPVPERRLDLMKAFALSKTGFQGRIINAENGRPIYRARVSAITGGSVEDTIYTNYDGIFTFAYLNSSKSYTLQVSKADYLTRNIYSGTPPAGKIMDLPYAYPILPSRPSAGAFENWRIVAYWFGCQPGYDLWYYDGQAWYPYHYYNAAGMEANAYLKDPDGNIYWWDNIGGLGVPPYHKYMYDSFDYFEALECHVIQDQKAGTYKYWLRCDIADYGWGTMKYSPGSPYYPNYPIVHVYRGNTLKAVIRSSAATRVGTGTKIWYVFDLNGSTVTVRNRIQDTEP